MSTPEPTPTAQAQAPAAEPTTPVAAPTRQFLYNGKAYDDPDPALSVDEVRKYLADFYEELTNADAEEQTQADGTLQVTFRRRVGTKG